MLLLLITDLRWNITGYAQMWRAQKRISNYNGLWQVTAVTYTNSLLVSLFLPSFPFWPLHLLSRAESLTTKAFLVPLPGVALHVEIVTKGVRKAGRSWTTNQSSTAPAPAWCYGADSFEDIFLLEKHAVIPFLTVSSEIHVSCSAEGNLYLQVQMKDITEFLMWIANLSSDELSVPFVPQINTHCRKQ